VALAPHQWGVPTPNRRLRLHIYRRSANALMFAVTRKDRTWLEVKQQPGIHTPAVSSDETKAAQNFQMAGRNYFQMRSKTHARTKRFQ